MDVSGNTTETSARVRVEAPLPEGEILEPLPGSATTARRTDLKVRCGERVAAAAWRVNQGPWTALKVLEGVAEERIPLRFGMNEIDVRLVDAVRTERVVSADITSTGQREVDEEQEEEAPAGPGGKKAEESEEEITHPEEPEEEGFVDLLQGMMGFSGKDDESVQGDESVEGEKQKSPSFEKDPGKIDVADVGPVDVTGPSDFLLPPKDDEEDDSWFEGEELVADEEGETGLTEEHDEIDRELAKELDALEDEEGDDHLFTETDQFDGLDGFEEETVSLNMEDWIGEEDNPDAPEQDPLYECLAEPFDDGGAPDSPFLPPSGLRGERGGCVAVETVQKDWYCTNRPRIQVGFQLPDWLKKLDLPKPGTKEYDEMARKMLQNLRDRGIDTSAFERFQEALIRRARMLESPDELPSFLQSLGLASMTKPSPGDVEATERWREAMENGARAWYLRLLASGDPQIIYEGLKARGEAFGKFDEALGLAADAMMTEIKANQQLSEQVLWSLPYVGPAMDILSIYTGETLSGEAMTPERAAMMLGLRAGIGGLFKLGPKAVAYMMNTPAGKTMLSKFAQRTAWMGPAAMDRLARATGLSEGELRNLASWTWKELTKERSLWGSRAAAQAGAAGGNFAGSPAGQAARRNLEGRVANGRRLIDRMQSTTNRHEFRRLALEMQQSKTTIALINDPSVPAALRVRVNQTLRAMGRLTDRRTAQGILSSAEGGKAIDRLLQKNPGLRRGDITVRSRTVSGVDLTRTGRDRDVWFQFVTGDGRVLSDVHHNVSAPIYTRELQSVTGLSAHQLDHTVTSVWHPDAYNPGRMVSDEARNQMVDDIVRGRAAGRLARPEDIKDTVVNKAKEWFDNARGLEAAGNQNGAAEAWAEGMRQLNKEYNRHVGPYLQCQGLNPATALPPRLNAALDVCRRVEEGVTSGAFTPEQGLQAIRSLSCRTPGGGNIPMSPDKAAEDLGTFIEMLNKWGIQGSR